MFYVLTRVLSSILEKNNFPGAVCSLVCGGADIGYVQNKMYQVFMALHCWTDNKNCLVK